MYSPIAALALFCAVSAVDVYETVYSTAVVHVNGNGQPVATASGPVPTSTSITPTADAVEAGVQKVVTDFSTDVVTAGGAGAPETSSPPLSPAPAPSKVQSPVGSDSSSPASPPAGTSSKSGSSPSPASGSGSGSGSSSGPGSGSGSGSNPSPASGPSSSSGSGSGSGSGSPTTSDTPSPSSSGSDDGDGSDIAQTCLAYHNRVRAQHGAQSLSWDQNLASFAQNYLDNSNCVFAHSHGPYGENIAMGFNNLNSAMDAWYNEKNLYDYATGGFSLATGHFTQMVWKGTSKIGCATTTCGSRGTYFACEYEKPGNMEGAFQQNVSPN